MLLVEQFIFGAMNNGEHQQDESLLYIKRFYITANIREYYNIYFKSINWLQPGDNHHGTL